LGRRVPALGAGRGDFEKGFGGKEPALALGAVVDAMTRI